MSITEPPEVPDYQYYLYSVLSTAEFLIGTPLNLLVLIYFLRKKERSNSRFTLLYKITLK